MDVQTHAHLRCPLPRCLTANGCSAPTLCISVRCLNQDSPLYAAGLREGDDIMEVAGKAVKGANEASTLLRGIRESFEVLAVRPVHASPDPTTRVTVIKSKADAPLGLELACEMKTSGVYVCIKKLDPAAVDATPDLAVGDIICMIREVLPNSVEQALEAWAEAPPGKVELVIERSSLW